MPDTPARPRPRFILLDNSIVALGGHYFPYAAAVLNAGRSRGYEPVLAAHRSFGDAVPEEIRVERVYRCDNWPLASRVRGVRWLRLNVLREAQAAAPGPTGRAPRRRSILGALRRRYAELDLAVRSREFARGTATVFDRVRPRAGDLIFLPNPWIPELRGLALAAEAHRGMDGASVHLLLRREFRPGESAALADALRRLAGRSPAVPVLFYTDTPELTELYAGAFGTAFRTLPIPHPIANAAARSGDAAIRISYVGDARGEKGFAALPDLVGRVLEGYAGGRPIRFVIQANAPSTGLEPEARRALASLRAFDPSLVSFIPEAQDRRAYEESITTSDIVLLPYRADRYRYRSSGILIEALSAGVPVLAPEGTWLASELRRFRQDGGASARATDGLAGGLYASGADAAGRLLHMLRHLGEFQAVARGCAPRVRRRHNENALLDALIDGAARPSP